MSWTPVLGHRWAVEVRWPPWFASLTAETVDMLDRVAVRQRYPAGAALFLEGDPGQVVLVIQRGVVKVSTAGREGREVVLEVLEPGAIVGELAAIDGQPRSATAVALSEVEVVVIPSGSFREIAEARLDLLRPLLHEVIRRLRVSDRRQLEFGGDALGRVCARLAELADRQGSGEVILPVNQSDLAAWTGLSREAVVKSLASLRRLEWLTTTGRQYVLLQPEEIRRRANH